MGPVFLAEFLLEGAAIEGFVVWLMMSAFDWTVGLFSMFLVVYLLLETAFEGHVGCLVCLALYLMVLPLDWPVVVFLMFLVLYLLMAFEGHLE